MTQSPTTTTDFVPRVDSPREQTVSNAVDWLKWIAIIAMFVDHMKYVGTEASIFHLLSFPGRIAFPIFAVLCGWNARHYSRDITRYALRIPVLGVAVQCFSFFLAPGRFNPVITLGLGVLACAAYKQRRLFGDMLLVLLIVPSNQFLQYGFLGLLIIPLAYADLPLLYIPLALCAGVMNLDLIEGMISASGAILAIYLLHAGSATRCPLPAGKWLYLAFPLSFVPPLLCKLLL